LKTVVLDTNCLLQILPKRSPYRWQLIQEDADDDKFVDCFLAAGADYLITNESHFDVLGAISFPKVVCLKLDEADASIF
jgi:hypothetical protein